MSSCYKGKSVNMTYKEFSRVLIKNGFVFSRQSGSHHIWVKGGKHISINQNPNLMVMRRLIKENNLEF